MRCVRIVEDPSDPTAGCLTLGGPKLTERAAWPSIILPPMNRMRFDTKCLRTRDATPRRKRGYPRGQSNYTKAQKRGPQRRGKGRGGGSCLITSGAEQLFD